ncbi:hypothetical protein P3X46_009160 [Hevea brasiliensis]|uniref:Bet v I/Major latex protein domain-containing protein n=1 Tax=Hevea brasiliensis TaxID=3981 RepID=A0ABQ9MQ21_HEVBR|nr:major allergen Pru ar 1 [Hevea brasiliensis]KAJ9180983.1 hypothetical protein P3X46_009160 [Hevea brasiliensis]
MGVITCEWQVATTVPPAKMFKTFLLDSEILLPKICPRAIKSVVILEGDGGPGTIKQINFNHGSELSHVKERIDAIDKENLTYDYSVIGGDPALLNKALDKISFQIKVESSPDGGSIFKRSSKSYTIDGAEVNEEEIKAGQEKAMEAFVGIFRAFEAYILANPDV